MKNDLETMEKYMPFLSCLINVTISNKMTERRACDAIRVNEIIFVCSFVKPKNIRLLGFDIRFTTTLNVTNKDNCLIHNRGLLFASLNALCKYKFSVTKSFVTLLHQQVRYVHVLNFVFGRGLSPRTFRKKTLVWYKL